MSASMIAFRQVDLRGPDWHGAELLWSGTMFLAAPSLPSRQDPIVGNHAIRLLAQLAVPEKRPIAGEASVEFHSPVLLSAAATPLPGYAQPRVTILGAAFAPVSVPDTVPQPVPDWSAFAELRLVPASDWPPASGFTRSRQTTRFEPSAPPLRVTQGVVPIGYAPGTDPQLGIRVRLQTPADGWASIFGSMRIRTGTVGERSAIAMDLTPEGVEFVLDVPSPFAKAQRWLTVRVRLEAIGEKTGRELVLRLVGGDREPLEELAGGLAWMAQDLSTRGGAVVLQVNAAGVPPVLWPLRRVGQAYVAEGPVPEMRVTPDGVTARLLTPEDIDGGEISVAELLHPGATLQRRGFAKCLRLSIDAALSSDGKPSPPGALVTMKWRHQKGKSELRLQPQSVEIKGGASAEAFKARVDTDALGERLSRAWGGAAVQPGERPNSAFLALARGWLQLPLPPPEKPPATAPRRSAINGFIRVDIPPDPNPPQAELQTWPRQTLPGLDVVSAQRVQLDITWDDISGEPQREISVTITGAAGTLNGVLWAGEACPTPVEILPSLAAGPAALADVPIAFGGTDTSGWSLTVTMGNGVPKEIDIARPQLALPTIAWLAHASQAMVSAVAMTRTADSALFPSTTRELVPVEVDAGAIQLTFAEKSRLPGLGAMQATPHGRGSWEWPWPPQRALRNGPTVSSPVEQAGVSLVSLTTAGIEFTAAGGTSFGFPALQFSLRYDLPILDELFANAKAAEPVREASAAAVTTPPPELEARRPTALDLPALSAVWRENALRLARARTQADRVILADDDQASPPLLWHPVDTNVGAARVEGIMEPYTWKPGSVAYHGQAGTLDLPLGAYRLGASPPGDWYHGARTLEGFSGTFKIAEVNGIERELQPDGDIHVEGFAANTLTRDGWHQDSRGLALASDGGVGPVLRWRDARRHGVEGAKSLRLATLAKPVEISIGDAKAWFWFRDLPLVPAGSGHALDLSGGLETEPGPDPAALGAHRLPVALYEWRLFPDGGAAFELTLGGPLSFRPLRLAKVTLGADGAPEALEVIGSVQVGSMKAEPGEAFAPERAYATGNLLLLEFTQKDHRLALRSLTRVSYESVSRSFKPINSSDPLHPLRFFVETDVVAGKSKDAEPGEVRVNFAASRPTEQNPQAHDPLKLAGLELGIRLFGQDCRLVAQTPGLNTNGLGGTFSGVPGKVLELRGFKFRWNKGERSPSLTITGGSLAAPLHAKSSAPNAFSRTYGEAGGLRWLGLTIAADFEEKVDHENGVVWITIDQAVPANCSLFRGFLLPQGRLRGSIALVFADARRTVTWPAPNLASAVAEFAFDADAGTPVPQRVTAVRHRHLGQPKPDIVAENDWRSRLLVDAAFATSTSTVEWPVGGLRLSGLATPVLNAPASWKATLETQPSGLVLEHRVLPRITAHALEVELLTADAGGTIVLDQPWRIRAAVDHEIRPRESAEWPGGGNATLAWSSIDEVSLFDMERLAQAAETDREAAAVKEPYAFAARYRRENRDIRIAGVVRRTLAGAGFPVRRMLANLHPTPEGQSPRASLLLVGASVVDIVLPREVQGREPSRAMGVTLVPQWVLPWVEADDAGIAPFNRIAQIEGHAERYEIAAYDAAAGQLRPLGSSAATPLGAQDGTEGLIEAQLSALAGTEGPAEHLMPVDQVFMARPNNTSPLSLEDDPPLLTRPLMVRSLLALKTIADRFTATTPQAWRQGITCVAGRTRDSREIRLAVSTWLNEPPAGATMPAVTMLVMDRDGARIEQLPETLAATLVEPGGRELLADGAERADAALRALSLSATPLLVTLACVDPSFMTIRVREVRGDPPSRIGALDGLLSLPPHVDWVHFAAPPALLGRGERRPLRDRSETIYASAALGWPEAADADLAKLHPRLGDEKVRRNADQAWAGRARSLSWPAKAWPGATEAADEFDRAAFVALGSRVALRRAAAQDMRSPPDRSAVIAPPRARAPTATAMQEAFEAARAPQQTAPSRLAPMLPGGMEVTVTGYRPGVMLTQHEGVLLASGDTGFDPGFDRFGRRASRGPVIARQLRAPRSSKLPETKDLDLRRRTFVGLDETMPGQGEETWLKPFKLVRGPAQLVRLYGREKKLPDTSITLRFRTPALGRIGVDWEGRIVLVASVPQGSAAAVLSRMGLLIWSPKEDPKPKPRAQLEVGGIIVEMDALRWEEPSPGASVVELTFAAANVADQARTALRAASADTPVRFTIRCGERDQALPDDAAKDVPLGKSDGEGLVPDPLVLTFDLPRVPGDRRWIAVPTYTVAFGDPAYDRELASPTRTAREVIARIPHILATDRAEYDRSATLHFAFWRPDGSAAGNEWTLAIAVQPRDGGKARDLRIAGIKPSNPLNAAQAHVNSAEAYAIPLPALLETGGSPARLLAGDRLQIAVTHPNSTPDEPQGISLTVGIVADAVLPPPAASYGLAVLAGSAQVRTALFATAPLPQRVEYPALLEDLKAGHVRRRALFLWSFAQNGEPTSGTPFAYLVKVDRTGGGQLPDRKADFRPYEE